MESSLDAGANAKASIGGQDPADWNSLLAHVRDLVGEDDDVLTRTLLGAFREDTPRHISAMREAVQAVDPARLARAAHSLRGSAGNVGANDLWQRAGEIENAARFGDWEKAEAGVEPLAAAWVPLAARIDAFLAGGGR